MTPEQLAALASIETFHVNALGDMLGGVVREDVEWGDGKTDMMLRYVRRSEMAPETVAAWEALLRWRASRPQQPLPAGWLGAKPDGGA